MEVKEFRIVKKNRKYFAAKLADKYDCEIVIDSKSENLELGIHTLKVIDESIRSKYGTQLRFRLAEEARDDEANKSYIVKTDSYNSIFVKRAKKLGGKWDAETKSWVFSHIVKEEAEELDFVFNSEKITVEVEFKKEYDLLQSSIEILGITLATATGRDSGAKIGVDISVIKGGFGSGGSVKNWRTVAYKETVVRFEVAEEVFEKFYNEEESDYYIVRKI